MQEQVVFFFILSTSWAVQEHADLISHIFEPESIDNFNLVHWEREPRTWIRNNSEYFSGVPVLSRANHTLSSIEQWLPYCKSTQPGSTHGKDMLLMNDVLFASGSMMRDGKAGQRVSKKKIRAISAKMPKLSTVLHVADHRVPSINSVGHAFESMFGLQTQINVYHTPAGPSKSALGLHYDMHDVFVLQMRGYKIWNVYAQPIGIVRHGDEKLDEKTMMAMNLNMVLNVALGPGDLMYIPRGFPHVAKNVDQEVSGEPSTHLTVTPEVHPFLTVEAVVLQVLMLVLQRNLTRGECESADTQKCMAGSALNASMPLTQRASKEPILWTPVQDLLYMAIRVLANDQVDTRLQPGHWRRAAQLNGMLRHNAVQEALQSLCIARPAAMQILLAVRRWDQTGMPPTGQGSVVELVRLLFILSIPPHELYSPHIQSSFWVHAHRVLGLGSRIQETLDWLQMEEHRLYTEKILVGAWETFCGMLSDTNEGGTTDLVSTALAAMVQRRKMQQDHMQKARATDLQIHLQAMRGHVLHHEWASVAM